MPVLSTVENTLTKCVILTVILSSVMAATVTAQMRKLYVDNTQRDNNISKISFISPAEGYVAFAKHIGYTTDSGKTFTPRLITYGNVDYNGYPANLTFGFGIAGVKALSRDSLVVYGDFGLVPSILYSVDGGLTFKLVFHSLYAAFRFDSQVTDMAFPQNNITGYAIDADRILKTNNKGLSWTPVFIGAKSYFTKLLAVDNNNVYVLSENQLLKTVNGGSTWTTVAYPEISIFTAYFIDPNTGWLNAGYEGHLFYTTNGGVTWTKKSEVGYHLYQMHFVSDSVGYSLGGGYDLYKTTDSGKVWEPLPRDNNYTFLSYGHEDLHFFSKTQFWAGGGQGFLEMTTNGGGTPYPKAYFKADTSQLQANHTVQLVNLSKPYYQYKWYKNGALISTSFHTSYVHDIYKESDTIKLVVQSGVYKDSTELMQYFNTPGPRPIPTISSFTPVNATPGTAVTINGTFFGGATEVTFGGAKARSFTVVSPTKIIAVVDTGSTGAVTVTTPFGTVALTGFTYNPPPVITAFTPTSGDVQTTVTIDGKYFNGATAVSFGGVAALSFAVESSSKITAVVGTGASGQLSVTTPYGVATAPGYLFTPHQPVITSFAPLSGAVNSVVSITGYNFNTTPANNIVYFGAVRARVETATPSLLTVEVPIGASYEPITVTTGSLTAYSNLPFRVTFPVEENLTANSFAPVKEFLSGINPYALSIIDIDGDGSLEIAASNFYNATVSILKNKAITDSMAFDPPVSYNMGLQVHGNSFGDIDGDGKADMVAASWQDHTVRIAKNTSVSGTISFAPPLAFPTRTNPNSVAIGDLDGDGRPDLVVGHSDGNDRSFRMSVLRNTSVAGVISFAQRLEFVSGGVPLEVGINDFDNDGWPDIVAVNAADTSVSIFKNTSKLGNLSFAKAQHYAIHNYSTHLNLGDYDGDGKMDIGLGSSGNDKVSVLRNISNPGSINFGNIQEYSGLSNISGVAAADLNGDDKPEIVTSSETTQVGIYKNTGNAGNISFDNRVDLTAKAWLGTGLALGDLDGDGMTDIAACTASNSVVSIFKNKASRVIRIRLCAAGTDTVIRNNLAGTSFQWQQNTGAGFVNISNNATFNGTNTSELHIKDIQLTWNNYQYRCVTDGKFGLVSTLLITPYKAPTVQISTTDTFICAGSQANFISDLQNEGSHVSYQWQVNGVNAVAISRNFTSTSLKNNDVIKLLVSGVDYCNLPFTIASNSIGMSVADVLNPIVDITASDSTICSGTPVTFTASARNAGTNPTYQWQLNFFNANSPNDSTFTVSQLTDGTQVRVIVKSNMACASADQTISRVIFMKVESQKVPMVTVKASSDTICAGNLVTFTANPTYGGTAPIYEWRINATTVGNSGPTFVTSSLVNGDLVFVHMASNYECVSKVNVTSNTTKISVRNQINPTVSIVATDTSICSGAQASFTSEIHDGGSNVSYQWQVNGVNTGAISANFTSTLLKNNDLVKLLVSGKDNCNNAFNIVSNSIVMRTADVVSPAVNITATSTTICAGTAVAFTANPTYGGTAPTYEWRKNSAVVGNNSPTYATNSLANGDRIFVQMVSSYKCASTKNVSSNMIDMSVNSPVYPTVNITGNTTVNQGQSTVLTAAITGGGNAPAYQWQDSTHLHGWLDITGATAGALTYTPDGSGVKVRCRLTSNALCTSVNKVTSAAVMINLVTGINPVPAGNYGIQLSPNPVLSTFRLDKLKLSDRWETLNVVSLDGKMRPITKNIKNQIQVTIDAARLSKGMYAVILYRQNGEAVYFKIIKM